MESAGMKNWTIRQRLLGSFALILALMLAMASVAYTRLVDIDNAATSAARDSIPGLYLSSAVRDALIMTYALTAQQLGQGDVLAMRELNKKWQEKGEELDALVGKYAATIKTAQDRELFAAFTSQLAAYKTVQRDILQLSADMKFDEVNDMWRDQLDPIFGKAHLSIQATIELNKSNANLSVQEIGSAIESAKLRMGISFLVTLLFSFLCAYALTDGISTPLRQLNEIVEVVRSGDFSRRLVLKQNDEFQVLAEGFNRMTDELTALVGQIDKSSNRVNTSVAEIAATARQQQATAGEIAATSTEIGATSREISATSMELVKTMSEVSQATEQSASLATSGQTSLASMEETMGRVIEAAASINSKLVVLNEKAGNINQVITTITKVADQTNLLSLNAAIEAEKAGEYGRGFSVVATEIRRLADQTAVATFDIEKMVKDIQSAVASGVMGMDKFSEEVRRGMQEIQLVGTQLSQIIHQVQMLAPRVESVNEGMQAQATGAEQISQSLLQLTESARQTVESLNQSTASINELSQVSNGLRNGVSRFKLQAA
jgi:methyl-accepting chemotaxis protein WspA